MKEPIIVTSFWDVGRGDSCSVPRTNDRYYKEFAAWARIRNRMIVFTDKKSYEPIKEIRSKYGLMDRTEIIVNEDIFSIERDMYDMMLSVEQDNRFYDFRLHSDAMSNHANFNYAWMMIYWCIAEAGKKLQDDDVIAWFDFGFNHLDRCYTKMEEFDFLWKLNRDINKITLYAMRKPSEVSLIESLQYLTDVMMGGFCLIPVPLAGEFWGLIKMAMNSLLMLGVMDDDQFLLHMAYRYKPDIFEIIINDWWYIALKFEGAAHLTVREMFQEDFKLKNNFKKLINHAKGFCVRSKFTVIHMKKTFKVIKRNVWYRAKIKLGNLVKGNVAS